MSATSDRLSDSLSVEQNSTTGGTAGSSAPEVIYIQVETERAAKPVRKEPARLRAPVPRPARFDAEGAASFVRLPLQTEVPPTESPRWGINE